MDSSASGASGYSGYSGYTGMTGVSAVSTECLLSFEEFDESVQVRTSTVSLCMLGRGPCSHGSLE